MARTRIPPERPLQPIWMYHPETGEGKIFQNINYVPKDWTRKPLTPETPRYNNAGKPLDRETIIVELTKIGLSINPIHSTHKLNEILNDHSPTRGRSV